MSLSARLAGPLVFVVLVALLGGCVTPGPSTRFYTLTPVVEAQPGNARPVAEQSPARPRMVVVKDIRLPLYLDRPQIVTRGAGNSLEWSEIDQWGGGLRDDMARILAMNLGRLLEGDRVVAAPYPAAKSPDCRIEVEIRSFERQSTGRVELIAQWWITRGSDGTLLESSEGTFLGDSVSDGASYDGLANAMSAVYGKLAQAIAQSVRSHVARNT